MGRNAMTAIFGPEDADPAVLDDASVAVVGYGNQGRSWALNLRDSGVTELVLSGVERTYTRLREEGFARQMEHHSPTSQYGQLSRRGEYDHLDVAATMRRLTDDITSGRFADEWDAERDAGHARLAELKERFCGPAVRAYEHDLRTRLGSTARWARPARAPVRGRGGGRGCARR